MLDKFTISVSYSLENSKKVLTTTEMDNDHFTITAATNEANRLVLDLMPKDSNTITVRELKVIYHYNFLPRFKQFQSIFCNGYQSASSSREYFTNEHTPVFKKKGSLMNKGDYAFTTSENHIGFFHSCSYTYIRSNDEIELFASLNEATGFTIFYFDVLKNEMYITKDLEGVAINSRYEILNVARYRDKYDVAFDNWFSDMRIPKPRVKHLKGYTTWYNYYNKISDNVILHDLESITALDQKIDMFQIDDGYQSAVGDWTTIKPTFSDMRATADAIHSKGIKAGLWLAPFAVSCKSQLYKEHKDWLMTDAKGKPLLAGNNWGADFYTLDFYKDEVKEHLRELFDIILKDWGFDMVKVDSLYQVCIYPYMGKSRGAVITDAVNLVRNLVGDKLILASGVPLVPAFGKVDFCRIGPDMDLKWDPSTKGPREKVSIVNNLNNSIFRRHLNGRAFANDPDVFLLRDNNIKLNPNQRRIIATINKIFGSVLFTSDDVSKYKHDWQKSFLMEMFNDDRINIMGAEYVTNNILHIKYIEEKTPHMLTIDMKTGVLYDQQVEAKDLHVSGIDDILSARGGEQEYKNIIDSEKNKEEEALRQKERNEIAAKNKEKNDAEIQERMAKIAELQKKREELVQKKQAEREAKLAKNAETEAKNAERTAKNEETLKNNAKIEEKIAKNAEIKAKNEEIAKKNAEIEAAKAARAEEIAKKKAELLAKMEAAKAAKAKKDAEDAKKVTPPTPAVKPAEPAKKAVAPTAPATKKAVTPPAQPPVKKADDNK